MKSLIELLPNEQVIVGIRKHWFVFFMESIGLFLAAIIPLFLLPFVTRLLPELVAAVGQARFEYLIIFAVAAWFILLTMIFFVIFTSYYLDMLVVTNQRLIDIDQIALFSRDVATMPLHNMEDIKVEELGIFATMFKFGNLHIQTAAETKEVIIHGIRHPERARNIILRTYQEAITQANPKP